MDSHTATVLPVPLNSWADHDHAFVSGPTEPASLPHPNPTTAFWDAEPNDNPLAKHGSTGSLPKEADVCIIGSGITGVSTAYHLSRLVRERKSAAPIRVVILEARDFCSGATGRNGGHLCPNGIAHFHAMSEAYGADEALRAVALEHHTVSGLLNIIEREGWSKDIDLVDGGSNELLFTQKEIDAAKFDWDAAERAGVDLTNIHILDKEDIEKTYGTPYAAVRIPAHNLWPLKLVTNLFNLTLKGSSASSSFLSGFLPTWSSSKGPFSLSLHTHTPANDITDTKSDRHRWKVHTPRGIISTNYVIHATNAYASHLLPHLAGPNGIVPTRGQIIATRAATPSLWKSAFSGNEGFEYWFPRPHKSNEKPLVILGGGREVTKPKYELYETNDAELNPRVSDTLYKFLPAVFPGKFESEGKPEYEWTGIMGFTKTGDPLVGPVPSDGEQLFPKQYIAAGYSGHGMPRSFACAEAVAQMIFAEIYGEQWEQPSWLPSWYLTSCSKTPAPE